MDKKALWRSWSTLIFWGIVALTIFGWIAGLFQMFSGLVQTIQGILSKVGQFGQFGRIDGIEFIQDYLDKFNTLMNTFEFLTIASWVIYLFGLYKFRNAQTSASAEQSVKSVNSAAWVGIVAAFFVIIAGWAPWFIAWLFRLMSWIFATISYFMFRSSFRNLESESAWSNLAQRGASLLRKSANYNIWLQFMPIIIFVIALIVLMTTYQSIMNSSGYGSSMGVQGYLGLYILLGTIIGLVILVLSILQLIYQIWGWNRIMRGEPIETVVTGVDQTSLIEQSENYIEDYHEEETPSTWEQYKWYFIGGFGGLLVIILMVVLFGRSPKGSDADIITDTISYTTDSVENNFEMTFEEAQAYEETDMDSDDDWDATTSVDWEGAINGKWAIEMTVHRLDGMVWGSYCYTKNKTAISLDGQWGEENQLTLTESVDGNITGKFIGTYGEDSFEGTWVSADGEKEYPFTLKPVYKVEP